MPVCQLCSKELKIINNHHLKAVHSITPKDYDVMFPGHERYDNEASLSMSKNSRKYTVNDNAFDQWSIETAWLVGLLTADGSVGQRQKPRNIVIYSTDREMLDEAQEIFGSNRPYTLQPKGNGHLGKKDVYQLVVSSVRLTEQLKLINCYGPKDMRNPFKIVPDKYKWSFIKGLFDGDGNFYKGTFSIAGREKLIKEVYEWICNEINREPNKLYKSTGTDKTVYFQFSKSDSHLIYHQIAHNAEETYDSEKFLKWAGYYEV